MLPFHKLCKGLDDIREKAKLDQKKVAFKRAMDGWREDFGEEDTLTALKFMACSRNEEVKIGIGDEKLSHIVARVMKTHHEQVKPKAAFGTLDHSKLTSHYANYVQTLRLTSDPQEQLTAQEVYRAIASMKDATIEKKESTVRKLIKNCSQQEMKWIFAIIVRDVEGVMKLPAHLILALASDKGNQNWINKRDLNQIFEMEEVGDEHLWQNFKPMLLARPKDRFLWWSEMQKHVGKDFIMELKFDGEHVIFHKADEKCKWITRNGMDFSKDYNKNVTPRIIDFFKKSVKSCILDCELVCYNTHSRKIVRHQDISSKNAMGSTQSFRKMDGSKDSVLAVIVFDVVYLNGQPLFDKPLHERKDILEKKILEDQREDTIKIVQYKIGSNKYDIKEFFHEAMKNDEEGIVVKNRDSIYVKGSRDSRFGLYKLKPSLSPDADLDLVTVGIHYTKQGHSVLLGAKRLEDPEDNTFSIVKSVPLKLGLNRILKDKFVGHCGKLKKDPPPNLVNFHGQRSKRLLGKTKIGFIDPEKWVVFQIRTNGITNGRLVNVTIHKWREDKEPPEADLVKVVKNYAKKIRNCKLPEESDRPYWDKPVKKESSVLSKRAIAAGHYTLEVKRVRLGSLASPIYGRKIFMQLGGGGLRDKTVDTLSKFGAIVLASPNTDDGERVDLMVSHTNCGKFFETTKKNNPDLTILYYKWVERCAEAQALVEWNEDELLQQGDVHWSDLKMPENVPQAVDETQEGETREQQAPQENDDEVMPESDNETASEYDDEELAEFDVLEEWNPEEEEDA